MQYTTQQAIDFFDTHKTNENESIISIKPIHEGLTNTSFYVQTNINQYQVRFATTSPGINRTNECLILSNISNLIYYDEQGNMIRTWIDANPITNKPSQEILDKLFNAVNKFHQYNDVINLSNLTDYSMYLDACRDDKMKQTYIDLIELFQQTYPSGLSHNDITYKNVLDDNQNLHLIDYEWSGLNYEWFDYLYFLINTELSNHLIVNELKNKYPTLDVRHLFFISYFCYNWTCAITDNRTKFKSLKKHYYKRCKWLFKKIQK